MVVILVPVDDGVLLIKRASSGDPGWALPGGYLEVGENWVASGAREVKEEAGVIINPHHITPFDVRSTRKGEFLLIFGLAERISSEILSAFSPNREVLDRKIITKPEELAFPLHTEVLNRYFQVFS